MSYNSHHTTFDRNPMFLCMTTITHWCVWVSFFNIAAYLRKKYKPASFCRSWSMKGSTNSHRVKQTEMNRGRGFLLSGCRGPYLSHDETRGRAIYRLCVRNLRCEAVFVWMESVFKRDENIRFMRNYHMLYSKVYFVPYYIPGRVWCKISSKNTSLSVSIIRAIHVQSHTVINILTLLHTRRQAWVPLFSRCVKCVITLLDTVITVI